MEWAETEQIGPTTLQVHDIAYHFVNGGNFIDLIDGFARYHLERSESWEGAARRAPWINDPGKIVDNYCSSS